ncbi:COG1361 S-layer family protein [Candidatus Woesearchaeota archaeon]|nr:COG1361 S-layer family protein [Candidatus Woesearchaeota archaeon]
MKKLFSILMVLTFLLVSTMSVSAATPTSDIRLSLINQNPYPATAGDVVEVRIGVENYGDTVKNLNVQLLDEYPFTIISEDTQTIATVNSYQEGDSKEILTYKIKIDDDAPSGTQDLMIRYSDSTSNIITQTSIPIEVSSSDKAEVIHIDKTVLIPGKETELTFRITNTGKSSLKDLTFSFDNPDKAILPVGSDNSRYINLIPAGGSEEITYTVIADTNVDPGLYELNLNLKYSDQYGTSNTKTTTAGVYVGGETTFSLAVSDTSSNSLTFSVANIGSNPAYSVLVVLPKQDGVSFSGANSQIIGNLDNGDYTLASFDASTTSNYVNLEISYTDTRGERITSVEKVELVSSTNSFGSKTSSNDGTSNNSDFSQRRPGNPMMALSNPQPSSAFGTTLKITGLVIILVIGGFVGYKRYKRKNSKNKKRIQ